VHENLQKALFDYERQQYNTVVSSCMSMVNTLNKLGKNADDLATLHEGLSIVLRLLAPIAPHVTHHLWNTLQLGDDILSAAWPAVDPEALKKDAIEIVVQ
jgi:leucyl-tRNA synthetase